MFKFLVLLFFVSAIHADLKENVEASGLENDALIDHWLSKECSKRHTRSVETEPHFSPLLTRSLLPACIPLFNMVVQPPYNVISITPLQLVPLKVRIVIRASQTNDLITTDGMVCDDSFNQEAALAVCRSMGKTRAAFLDNVQWTPDSSCLFQYRSQSQTNQCQFILDDVTCNTGAMNLNQCGRREIFSHNCASNEHVSVICS